MMGTVENISLFELQQMIRESISGAFAKSLWVRAEISEVKGNTSGHCYLTVVDKAEGSVQPRARASAIIWSSSWRVLRPYFESETGAGLAPGMNILVRVQVQYSELYGLSLIVHDIDPSFTVGALEQERLRTIARLREEGMFDMNSSLELPRLPGRLAVISSPTAAGYRDFMRHLHENEYGYKFHTELFPALMQGQDAPASIISALDAVVSREKDFDAILILRGGGGAMDLVCFDDYELAVNVAQCPMPVLTGIGHDHDYHVVDMVACVSVKTPTALSDFILNIFLEEDSAVDLFCSRIKLALAGKYQREYSSLDLFAGRIRAAVNLKGLDAARKLELLEYRVNAANPVAILEKGYALALKRGCKVDSISKVESGDTLKLLLRDGSVECIVR